MSIVTTSFHNFLFFQFIIGDKPLESASRIMVQWEMHVGMRIRLRSNARRDVGDAQSTRLLFMSGLVSDDTFLRSVLSCS
jgi:hypothetical protein